METERRERPARAAVSRTLASSFLLVALAATLDAQQPQAGQTAVPQLLPVMGTLVGPTGAPLSGSMGATFAVYDEPEGGVPLWMERQIVTVDAQGRFAVWVGALGQALPSQLFQSGQARWMGVTPDGFAEQPRGRFVAVPYAPQPGGQLGPGPMGNGGDSVSRPLPVPVPADPQKHVSRRDPSEFAGVLDVVIPDDQIVQGSICVGLDCVNNENFGFDTIRMKENNTRIQFNDTSGAGFPTNNWQIRANDSAGGGGSFLGFVDQGAAGESETGTISFRVDAGAPANALRVSSTGRVGIRTATPVLDVHMNNSNTPAIRLEQNNTGGFTAQTWDVASNEANFFIRDVTGGSLLPFRIRPGAPTSSIDISSDGDVGIGTQAPQQKLDVSGNIQTSGFVLFTGGQFGLRSAGGIVAFDAGSAFPTGYRLGTSTDVQALTINTAGDVGLGVAAPTRPLEVASGAHVTVGGVWTNASSRTLKDQIAPLTAEAAAAVLDGLQPMTYVYKTDPADPQVGFIAEDVPDLVATPDRKSLASMDVVAVAVKVIQEQQRQLAQLREASQAQAEEVAVLRARLADLERLLVEARRER